MKNRVPNAITRILKSPAELKTAFTWIDSLSCQLPFTIHQRPEWYSAYIQAFRPSVLFLQVLDLFTKSVIGLLPLQVQRSRGTRFWDFRTLFPLAHGPSDFVNLLVEPGCEEEFADALAGWLWENPNSWERLFLPYIPAASPAWKPLVRALRRHRFDPQVDVTHRFYEVATRGDWDEYLNVFFRDQNPDLFKDMRRLDRENARPRLVVKNSGIEEYLPRLLPIYAERRTKTRQRNSFEAAEKQDFFRRVLHAYEPLGLVELSMLIGPGDDIWAYQLDWLDQGRRFHYMHAYDERYARHSPGKLLLFEILQRSFSQPEVSACNFMRGEAAYKKKFAAHGKRYVYIQVVNPRSLRNKGADLAAYLMRLRDGARSFLRGAS